MFDIGFAELMIIGIVGLLVIGPDRLPETLRTGALWMGRARRTYSKFRRELEEEIGADDIRRELHNEAILEELKGARDQLNNTINLDAPKGSTSETEAQTNVSSETDSSDSPSPKASTKSADD